MDDQGNGQIKDGLTADGRAADPLAAGTRGDPALTQGTGPGTGRRAVRTAAGFGAPIRPSKLQRFREEAPNFVKKNKGLLAKPAFWSMMGRLSATRARSLARPPVFPQDGPVRFIATHHKVMTTYFHAVGKLLASGLGIPFQKIHIEHPDPKARLVLSMHGKFDLARLAPYRGVHIMRDPRDMIVSGYNYHKWTHELWAHRPDETGQTYQQKLRAADRETGLFMEIDHFIFFYRATLEAWDMDDPDILEVPYEALMGDGRDDLYVSIFSHLGLEGRDLALGVDLMRLFEAGSRTGRKAGAPATGSHIRSGASGQWKQELSPAHVAYIDAELGGVLTKFGYA